MKIDYGKIKCLNCKEIFQKQSRNNIWCESCRPAIKKEDKLRYYKKVKGEAWYKASMKVKAKREYPIKRNRIIEIGKQIAAEYINADVLWKESHPLPDFDIKTTICIPFDWSLSKNAMKNFANGHYYLNPNTKLAKEAIIEQLQAHKHNWVQSKIYLDIFVEKPNNRGDAINFIDTIADAVVKALGVDDRWFAIDRVDWQINKNDPKIWLTIKQKSEPLQACSHCGRLLTLDKFSKNRQYKLGVGRACVDCRTLGEYGKDKKKPRVEVCIERL